MLGMREPEVYGTLTLAQLDDAIESEAKLLGLKVSVHQFNSEGAMIDAIHAARSEADAIVLNPGAFGHYAYAVRDALAAVGLPAIEVHLTNVYAREPFRAHSVVAPVCLGSISGFGAGSYLLALRALRGHTVRKPA